MGKNFGVFFLMGTQNRSKTPYGKDFGWTPPTPGGGGVISLYQAI